MPKSKASKAKVLTADSFSAAGGYVYIYSPGVVIRVSREDVYRLAMCCIAADRSLQLAVGPSVKAKRKRPRRRAPECACEMCR